jgi:mannitol/fructose-specific phosphotransferase system IIA component (Ntr-type)
MERVKVPLDSLDKPGILRELSEFLAHTAGIGSQADEIHRAVLERETLLSTGVGRGVGLPHAKCSAVDRLELVAGTTREPVDFEAVDGEPVDLLIMIVGPASAASHHVKTLGHISRTLKDEALRSGLAGATGPVEFMRLLAEAGA